MSKIILKRSSVDGKTPTAGDLDYGELAINYENGRIWYKNASNEIKNFVDSDLVVTLIGIHSTGSIDSDAAAIIAQEEATSLAIALG